MQFPNKAAAQPTAVALIADEKTGPRYQQDSGSAEVPFSGAIQGGQAWTIALARSTRSTWRTITQKSSKAKPEVGKKRKERATEIEPTQPHASRDTSDTLSSPRKRCQHWHPGGQCAVAWPPHNADSLVEGRLGQGL